MTDQPRSHHVRMKYQLARMALQDAGRFFATFGPGGDAAFLADLWAAIGERLPTTERIPNDGATTWHRPAGSGPELLVLILPPPTRRNEAYFVGACRLPNGACRVFFLERTVMSAVGAEDTILAELAADGRSNWGHGSRPVVEEFAELLNRIVGDPSARPIAFVPMQVG